MVEQRTENPRVGGSIPPCATTYDKAWSPLPQRFAGSFVFRSTLGKCQKLGAILRGFLRVRTPTRHHGRPRLIPTSNRWSACPERSFGTPRAGVNTTGGRQGATSLLCKAARTWPRPRLGQRRPCCYTYTARHTSFMLPPRPDMTRTTRQVACLCSAAGELFTRCATTLVAVTSDCASCAGARPSPKSRSGHPRASAARDRNRGSRRSRTAARHPPPSNPCQRRRSRPGEGCVACACTPVQPPEDATRRGRRCPSRRLRSGASWPCRMTPVCGPHGLAGVSCRRAFPDALRDGGWAGKWPPAERPFRRARRHDKEGVPCSVMSRGAMSGRPETWRPARPMRRSVVRRGVPPAATCPAVGTAGGPPDDGTGFWR